MLYVPYEVYHYEVTKRIAEVTNNKDWRRQLVGRTAYIGRTWNAPTRDKTRQETESLNRKAKAIYGCTFEQLKSVWMMFAHPCRDLKEGRRTENELLEYAADGGKWLINTHMVGMRNESTEGFLNLTNATPNALPLRGATHGSKTQVLLDSAVLILMESPYPMPQQELRNELIRRLPDTALESLIRMLSMSNQTNTSFWHYPDYNIRPVHNPNTHKVSWWLTSKGDPPSPWEYITDANYGKRIG